MAAELTMDAKVRAMLEADVAVTHERLCAAMATRLPTLGDEAVEAYFAALAKLVGRLEDDEKTLGQVLGETMPEVANLVMQQMQGRSD